MYLQTIPGINVNNISKELEKYLSERPLKGYVKYRMLNGTRNIDPKAVKGVDDIVYPSNTQLNLKARIIDPGTKQPVDIGQVLETNEKHSVTRWGVKFIPGTDRGVFVLHEGILDEMEIYPIVELMNENASNPFRDKSVTPLFERIDEVSLAKARVAQRNLRREMMEYIGIMDPMEKRQLYTAIVPNGSFDEDIDVITDALETSCEADPEKFQKIIKNSTTAIKSVIKQAIDKGKISFNPMLYQYTWTASQEVIHTLDRKEGVEPADLFAEWLDSSKNGGTILKQIKNLIAPEDKKK